MTCPRGAARNARHSVKVEIVGSNPIGGAEDGTVRQRGRAAKLKPWCPVGSTPTRATGKCASAGHWRAQVAVTHPPRAVQVRLLPDALDRQRWPVGLSVQDTSPSRWRGGFDSRTGYWTDRVSPSGGTGDTQRSGRCALGTGVRVQFPPRRLLQWRFPRRWVGPADSHKVGRPGSTPGPGTAGGPVFC